MKIERSMNRLTAHYQRTQVLPDEADIRADAFVGLSLGLSLDR
jgi:hypothetical protein